ncbi:hypothetical protein ACROYT_G009038 [Oculina patagonica]
MRQKYYIRVCLRQVQQTRAIVSTVVDTFSGKHCIYLFFGVNILERSRTILFVDTREISQHDESHSSCCLYLPTSVGHCS